MSQRHTAIVESLPAQAAARAAAPRPFVWPNEAATERWAQALARQLTAWPGGADACIALHGDLGAGKTTWVRHLLRACGVQGRIKSPTYAVVEPHTGCLHGLPWPIWHFDFYRFNDPQEWADAGFRDVFAGPGLKLMEWPDKAAGVLPAPDWALAIETAADDTRHVRLAACTPRGALWLDAFDAS